MAILAHRTSPAVRGRRSSAFFSVTATKTKEGNRGLRCWRRERKREKSRLDVHPGAGSHLSAPAAPPSLAGTRGCCRATRRDAKVPQDPRERKSALQRRKWGRSSARLCPPRIGNTNRRSSWKRRDVYLQREQALRRFRLLSW